MYVAVTRARRRLYLTHAQSRMLHGQVRYNIASRFLDEVPGELVQWFSSRRRAVDVDAAEWGSTAAADAPRSAPRAAARGTAGPVWRIGQAVRHAKFGVGMIIDAEGRGADQRVQVNFRNEGVKWLALEFANLEAA